MSHRIRRGLDGLAASLRKRGIEATSAGLAALLAAESGRAAALPASLAHVLDELPLAPAAVPAAGGGAAALGTFLGAKSLASLGAAGFAAAAVVFWSVSGVQIESGTALDAAGAVPAQPADSRATAEPAGASEAVATAPAPAEQAPKTAVAGVVRSGATGKPLPGAVVTVWHPNGRRTIGESTADQGGHYIVRGIPPGHEVWINARDEASGQVGPEPTRFTVSADETGTLDLNLEPGGAIAGDVTDRTITYHPSRLRSLGSPVGHDSEHFYQRFMEAFIEQSNAPVPDVAVTLQSKSPEAKFFLPRTVYSDDAGQFRFPALPPGRYEVRAEVPAGAVVLAPDDSSRFRLVAVGAGEHKEGVPISLRFDGVAVSGLVTDGQGKSVAGARVLAEHEPPLGR